MTPDREQLEFAAKAAGIDAHWGDGWQRDMMFRALPRSNSPLVTNIEWNPLIEDGDEARLEAALMLNVYWWYDCVSVRSEGGKEEATEYYADHNSDKQAARRAAGVR